MKKVVNYLNEVLVSLDIKPIGKAPERKIKKATTNTFRITSLESSKY